MSEVEPAESVRDTLTSTASVVRRFCSWCVKKGNRTLDLDTVSVLEAEGRRIFFLEINATRKNALLLALNFVIVKACYRGGFSSAQFSGFKLASSMFVQWFH